MLGAGVATSEAPADAGDPEAGVSMIRPEAIRADMRFLADDLLEGRRAGTRGHQLAAQFVAAQFESMGLEPAGRNGTFFQDVPLQSAQVDESASSFKWSNSGADTTLKFREDYILYGDPGRGDSSLSAPIVFVGIPTSLIAGRHAAVRVQFRGSGRAHPCRISMWSVHRAADRASALEPRRFLRCDLRVDIAVTRTRGRPAAGGTLNSYRW